MWEESKAKGVFPNEWVFCMVSTLVEKGITAAAQFNEVGRFSDKSIWRSEF